MRRRRQKAQEGSRTAALASANAAMEKEEGATISAVGGSVMVTREAISWPATACEGRKKEDQTG